MARQTDTANEPMDIEDLMRVGQVCMRSPQQDPCTEVHWTTAAVMLGLPLGETLRHANNHGTGRSIARAEMTLRGVSFTWLQVQSLCPFYLARELTGAAELIFMPYNYLVDAKTRASIKQLSLEGAILIFDEAHNIEVAPVEAVSCM